MHTNVDDRPLISVIMGVCHQKENVNLLKRSITSILEQTYTNFEFLICEHGSTEEAKQVIDYFEKQDKRIKVIRPGKESFLAEKLNICLKEARGQLIARMDDDDYSHPERFEKQVDWLEKNPEIDFVGSNVSLYCGKEKIGTRKLPQYPEIKDFLFVQPYVHPTIMFRYEPLAIVKGYSESKCCILCEDYDLFLRLYEEKFQGANLQEVLLDYTTRKKGNRKMRHRWNESITRYQHFKKLGLLPQALLYVIKPILAGLIPEKFLIKLKTARLKNSKATYIKISYF